jgi:hypothetical protein
MRAVKSRSFLLAAVAVVAGLNEAWALWAAIAGFLLSLVPLITAPRVVPVEDHQHGIHSGTKYRLHSPLAPQPPVNPTPSVSYTQGSWE